MKPQAYTVVKPPREVFAQNAAAAQDVEEATQIGLAYEKVEYPPEGGQLMYYYDHPFPFKGNPYSDAVNAVHVPKKLFKATTIFIKEHPFIFAPILILPTFITRRLFVSVMDQYVEGYAEAVIKPHMLSEERWCRSVREIRRAGKVVQAKYSGRMARYIEMVVNILSSVLEWDNAWRLRVQDILGEVNGQEFLKDPRKEIMRLLVLEVRRERGWSEDKGRFMQMGSALRFVMFFKPFLKKILKEFIAELNIEEVKLDEADEYYCLLRPDYDAKGVPFEYRQKKFISILTKYRKDFPERFERLKNENFKVEEILDGLKDKVMIDKGFPVMIFYAVPQPDEKTEIKMLATKILEKNPNIRQMCGDLLMNKTINITHEEVD